MQGKGSVRSRWLVRCGQRPADRATLMTDYHNLYHFSQTPTHRASRQAGPVLWRGLAVSSCVLSGTTPSHDLCCLGTKRQRSVVCTSASTRRQRRVAMSGQTKDMTPELINIIHTYASKPNGVCGGTVVACGGAGLCFHLHGGLYRRSACTSWWSTCRTLAT